MREAQSDGGDRNYTERGTKILRRVNRTKER
jgi:hypothetical protein